MLKYQKEIFKSNKLKLKKKYSKPPVLVTFFPNLLQVLLSKPTVDGVSFSP